LNFYSSSQLAFAREQTRVRLTLGTSSEPDLMQYEPGSCARPSVKLGMTSEQENPEGHSQ
jgi:hypothetical protein